MQIHPLFTVKKAAEVLGVEKQFLRDQLETGTIRGEKRRVGERDKWFIYHGEVKDLRDTKRLHQLVEKAKRISTEDLQDFFEGEEAGENKGAQAAAEFVLTESFYVGQSDLNVAENLVLSTVVEHELEVATFESLENIAVEIEELQPEPELEHFSETVSGSTSITLDVVLQKLTVEFAYRLSEERSRVCALEHLLETKEERLRLLPDLEKQLLAEQTKLQAEQAVRRSHEEEVVQLKEKIRTLEQAAQEKPEPKSWWRRLFA
jgi:hypothetical protein